MPSPSTENYYEHGNSGGQNQQRFRRTAPVLSLSVLLAACGASNTQLAQGARRVPVAHIAELPEAERPNALASLPVVLEIRKGDRFPIEAVLDSRLLRLHTEGTWSLEATQTFYVLLHEDGPPAISEDGIDFDSKPKNSFAVGFGAKKSGPTKVRMVLGFHAKDPAPEAK